MVSSRGSRSSVARIAVPAVALAILACSGGKSEGDTAVSASLSASSSGASETTGIPTDPCMQVPDPGDCEAAFDKWAYDPATQRCYVWTWGGCDGVVPFDDLASCQAACEPCETYLDGQTPAPSADPVPIAIRNESAAAAWIQAYTESNDALGYREQIVAIKPVDAEPLITAPNACDFGCGDFDNDLCAAGCSDGGPPPPPIYLAPGGIYTTSWIGQRFAPVTLPERCLPRACEGPFPCLRWENAATGPYTAKITFATAIQCVDPGCTCTPNAEGWCTLDAVDAALLSPKETSAPLLWPGSTIDFVIVP